MIQRQRWRVAQWSLSPRWRCSWYEVYVSCEAIEMYKRSDHRKNYSWEWAQNERWYGVLRLCSRTSGSVTTARLRDKDSSGGQKWHTAKYQQETSTACSSVGVTWLLSKREPNFRGRHSVHLTREYKKIYRGEAAVKEEGRLKARATRIYGLSGIVVSVVSITKSNSFSFKKLASSELSIEAETQFKLLLESWENKRKKNDSKTKTAKTRKQTK